MNIYAAFHNPEIPLREAIGEGGAGWLRGKPTVQMHVGGWDAVRSALTEKRTLPPIDPAKARAYWSQPLDGDVVLSNFYEDGTDAYSAKQLVAALSPAQPRLIVAHYGFPSFVPNPNNDAFWKVAGWTIDIICPAYYASDESATWSATDYERMAYCVSESRRLTNKPLGFCVSPFTHSGKAIAAEKFKAQVRFLKAIGVQHLFIWTDQPKHVATVAACGAAAAFGRVEMQE